MGYYVKLFAETAFPVLYHILCQKFNNYFGKCFKLKDGKLCGVFMGYRYVYTVFIPLVVILREVDEKRLILEVFSCGYYEVEVYGLPIYRSVKQYEKKNVQGFLDEILRNNKIDYQISEELSDTVLEDVFSDFEKLVSEEGKLMLEKFKLEKIEKEKRLEEERLETRERVKYLPEKLKILNPCPFLEVSSEFSDIFICGAFKYTYVPLSSMTEKEVVKRCAHGLYANCKYYFEALKKLRTCPFLKEITTLPNNYTCEASKFVHVPFSKISEEEMLNQCAEKRYYSCTYYLEARKTLEKRIREIREKIAEL